MADPRLPPFTDAMLELRDPAVALAYLTSLRIPRHLVAYHLQRYGECAEVSIPSSFYKAARGVPAVGYY